MKHTLEISGIRLSFGERLILSDVYLKIETGDIIGLLGRNGCGKTCLMRIILGSLPAEKSILIDEESLFEAYRHPKLIRYVPQHNFIPKSLTLKRIFSDFSLDFSVFTATFPEFETRYKSRIGHLSGGMRRIVELYVIMKSPTQFVLLDEPFTHVSPMQIDRIKAIIDEERPHKGFFITDHMHRHMLKVCDKIYLLSDGKTHLVKQPDDLKRLGYLSYE